MHSGNGTGGLNGFVSTEELQQMFLPSIFETYATKGYRIFEVIEKRTEYILGRDESSILTDRFTSITLEEVIVKPDVVTAFHPSHGYAAFPVGWHNGSKFDLKDKIFVAQYRGIEFNALLFFVAQKGVFVTKESPREPVQLSFYEFHTALERWLPKAAKVMAGLKNGPNINC